MKWGIDVSEHNGSIPWRALKRGGLSFAIVRLGWGQVHLDELFYENINGALAADIEVGIYYYSYALTMEAAAREARFASFVLRDCGLSPAYLPMGCWLDMEDADRYKEKNGLTDGQVITANGSYKIPDGVGTVTFEATGAGGGGGGRAATSTNGGGRGGAGAIVRTSRASAGGLVFAVTVGSGGGGLLANHAGGR